MKSYFSRFLHHTLSHSGIREMFTSSLSLSDLIGESRSKQIADLSNLDYRVKFEDDSLCAGRSMVEMLGVLAIIGVLSVGAIAGYSKAMMKYKLNQHAVAVSMLINNVLQIKEQLAHTPNASTYYGTMLHKLNLLPDGIEYITNATLQDTWFNAIIAVYHTDSTARSYGGIHFIFPQNALGAEICRNIVTAAKENAADLWLIEGRKYNDSDNPVYYGHAYGDNYCGNDKKCIRALSLNDISQLCNICDDQSCDLYVLYTQ